MEFWLKITCDNAAFEDQESLEVSRILKKAAERIEYHPDFMPGHSQPLYDANGNEVGFFGLHDEAKMLTKGER